jgi:hypothetical protein
MILKLKLAQSKRPPDYKRNYSWRSNPRKPLGGMLKWENMKKFPREIRARENPGALPQTPPGEPAPPVPLFFF